VIFFLFFNEKPTRSVLRKIWLFRDKKVSERASDDEVGDEMTNRTALFRGSV